TYSLFIYNINLAARIRRGGTRPWTGPGRGVRETTGGGGGMPSIASGASPGSFGDCRRFKHRARPKGAPVTITSSRWSRRSVFTGPDVRVDSISSLATHRKELGNAPQSHEHLVSTHPPTDRTGPTPGGGPPPAEG